MHVNETKQKDRGMKQGHTEDRLALVPIVCVCACVRACGCVCDPVFYLRQSDVYVPYRNVFSQRKVRDYFLLTLSAGIIGSKIRTLRFVCALLGPGLVPNDLFFFSVDIFEITFI